MSGPKPNIAPQIAPEIEPVEEDDEQSLPQPDDEAGKLGFEEEQGSLAAGRMAILEHLKHAPSRPGVYRMIDQRGDVLYVGKAKNIKKRVAAYARPTGLDTRIERMVAATRKLEFVVTRTETEALLLEANLIKRLRPRFNVTLRDDKSFPYIVITSDHWAPQILKHRGARSCCARAAIRSSRAARGRVCSIRSSAARRRAPRRSIFPIIRSWCARRTPFCPAAAKR
jgi:excinuclease ABC subunit C